MAEYRYYLIPDFMSYVFPQQFEEQAPTEFFSNTADLMKRYQQLREMSTEHPSIFRTVAKSRAAKPEIVKNVLNLS